MTDSLELRSSGQAEGTNRVQQIAANAQRPRIPISEKTSVAKSVVSPREVWGLTIYYVILLIASLACIVSLGACLSNRRILLAKEARVRF